MSSRYLFTDQFRELYTKAIERYAAGVRTPDALFRAPELALLAEHGLTAQNFFDYAEDQASYGEPGFEQALLIEALRRDYFWQVQKGQASTRVLDVERMPAKTDAVRGIEWLPRLLPKTRAKLAGELPSSLMYCCGGDRRFFRTHDIQPAEFLNLVWRHGHDDAPVIEWVVERRKARGLPVA